VTHRLAVVARALAMASERLSRVEAAFADFEIGQYRM
jgi:hypothetical protein